MRHHRARIDLLQSALNRIERKRERPQSGDVACVQSSVVFVVVVAVGGGVGRRRCGCCCCYAAVVQTIEVIKSYLRSNLKVLTAHRASLS
jgi:hypothetical protein